MPEYLFEASYTAEGAKGLIRDGGSKRRAAVETVTKSLGGRLEAFYFAYGKTDAFVIVELPDSASATAVALTVGASGAVPGPDDGPDHPRRGGPSREEARPVPGARNLVGQARGAPPLRRSGTAGAARRTGPRPSRAGPRRGREGDALAAPARSGSLLGLAGHQHLGHPVGGRLTLGGVERLVDEPA